MIAQARQTNRYDLIRIILALIVLACHVIALPGQGLSREMEHFLLETLGQVAIQGFFVISGALVLGSLERSSSVGSYAMKRVRRLYPAYFVIILVTTLLALALVPTVREDLVTTGKYVFWNLIFLNFIQPDLPGLFQDHRFTAVNGALWTVKVEVMFYIALPILIAILKFFGKARYLALIAIYIAAEAWRIGFERYGLSTGSNFMVQVGRQLPGQMSFFVAGMLLWEFRDLARKYWLVCGAIGAVGLFASYLPLLEPIRAISVTGLVAAIALSPGPELNAGRYGDFSYGIYGTHFPITQSIIALGVFQTSVVLGYVVATAITFAAAVALWVFVEKPALDKRNWYRRKADGKKPPQAT